VFSNIIQLPFLKTVGKKKEIWVLTQSALQQIKQIIILESTEFHYLPFLIFWNVTLLLQ
jgi:hypothetical protein